MASETASNRLYLTLHLAVKGPWTSALRTRLLSGESVSLQVEGPYETTLDNPPTTQVVVMVAGGLGVSMTHSHTGTHARTQAHTQIHVSHAGA